MDRIVLLCYVVVLQVFMDSASYIEVTQLSLSTQAGSASKRRRLDTGWALLRGILEDSGNTLLSLPWLFQCNRFFH